jgi:hypothetical protein
MKTNRLTTTLVAGVLMASGLSAVEEGTPKRALKANYQEVYNETPGKAESFTEMFSEGMVYGRLRSNTFWWWWQEDNADQDSHLMSGLGGSLIYKTASLSGFDMTGGLYYSRAFLDEDSQNLASAWKPGADTLSRFDYTNTGNKSIGVLGQAYIRYTGFEKSEVKFGRQLVETFYTKSNDSKMAPNTFDGLVFDTKLIDKTAIRLGYLTAQKLRAHTQSHSVLMYGDANSTSANNAKWSENDDSVMHKGLTYTRLKAAGVDTEAPLIVGDIHNKSVENLKLDGSFYVVPDLVSQVMGEANYKISFGDYSLTPGVRYIRQFDNGAGAIGGAALSGNLAGVSGSSGGYDDADSVDGQMIAARLVSKFDRYKINLGYTQTMDEADLIAPWRGFLTAGYTRSMARFNWFANMKSYRLEVVRNDNKKGVFKDLYIMASVMHTDADETKGFYDEEYYYLGFIQNIPSMIDLQWRLRLGYADTERPNADNLDARFEINYLF